MKNNKQTFLIAPSILSSDFFNLGNEIESVIASGADLIHFDVMDNHYVPNLSFGPVICEALKKHKVSVPIDVHLMTSPVDSLIKPFAEAGARYISFHPEATSHVDRTIQLIKSFGCKPGLVLNPSTPLSYLDYTIEDLDLILLMSVNPGFGGQSFIPKTLDKISKVRERIDQSTKSILLEVDGGITVDNIASVAEAGANAFVMGTAIFGSSDYDKTFRSIRDQLKTVSD